MNGKQSKRLRSLARSMATMAPDHRSAQIYKAHKRDVVVGVNHDGTEIKTTRVTGSLINNPRTARGIYQTAKRRFKALRKSGAPAWLAQYTVACGAALDRDRRAHRGPRGMPA